VKRAAPLAELSGDRRLEPLPAQRDGGIRHGTVQLSAAGDDRLRLQEASLVDQADGEVVLERQTESRLDVPAGHGSRPAEEADRFVRFSLFLVDQGPTGQCLDGTAGLARGEADRYGSPEQADRFRKTALPAPQDALEHEKPRVVQVVPRAPAQMSPGAQERQLGTVQVRLHPPGGADQHPRFRLHILDPCRIGGARIKLCGEIQRESRELLAPLRCARHLLPATLKNVRAKTEAPEPPAVVNQQQPPLRRMAQQLGEEDWRLFALPLGGGEPRLEVAQHPVDDGLIVALTRAELHDPIAAGRRAPRRAEFARLQMAQNPGSRFGQRSGEPLQELGFGVNPRQGCISCPFLLVAAGRLSGTRPRYDRAAPMSGRVSLPLWLALLLALLAAWAVLDRLLVPSVRWYLRRRVNRVIDEVNARLKLEIPAFHRTKRQVLIDRLLYDPKVVEAVDLFAREQSMPREVVMARVERYAREIVPAFNVYFYFRIGTWLSRSIAQLLYRVRLGFTDEAGLAAVTPGSTVVFLMNHRSNMDYILVAYLAADRTALSYAVGEWARVWPLQALIRSTGAYFVRRGSGDPLYRRVLERYIHMATSSGVPQAVYPEGGLSRDGRLRPPKLGLLDYMLRGFDPQGDRDLVFIPVGINYDRVLEDRTLLLDLQPAAVHKPPLAAALTTLRFVGHNLALRARNRWHRFGYACVSFGTPISMRRYLGEHDLDLRRLGKDDRAAHLERLGRHLMGAVGQVIPVVPVPLVASAILEHGNGGLSELDLKALVHQRMAALDAAGAHVYIPRRDLDYAIVAGLRTLTLRHIVVESDGLFRANPDEALLLRYYANSIAHLVAGGEARSQV